MGHIQSHRSKITERTDIDVGQALRGRVYEIRYESDTATKGKYVVLGINIYPKGGLVLAQGITGSALQMLCDGHGYDYRPLVWQQQGVTYGSQ